MDKNKHKDKFSVDLEGLRKLGYAVMDVVGDGYEAKNDVYKFLVVSADKHVYSKKIKDLIGIALDEAEAQEVMENIYKHKWIESEKLHHDIGLKKAASEWYEKYYESWSKTRGGK
ncbi:MAG: hypothetical protein ABH857_02110 [Elusimicrobiota bacterium]